MGKTLLTPDTRTWDFNDGVAEILHDAAALIDNPEWLDNLSEPHRQCYLSHAVFEAARAFYAGHGVEPLVAGELNIALRAAGQAVLSFVGLEELARSGKFLPVPVLDAWGGEAEPTPTVAETVALLKSAIDWIEV